MSRAHTSRLAAGARVITAGAICALALAGCYRRIVGAQGPGADRVDIQQSNIDDQPKILGYPQYTPKTMPGSSK